jgi:hypothetical protein
MCSIILMKFSLSSIVNDLQEISLLLTRNEDMDILKYIFCHYRQKHEDSENPDNKKRRGCSMKQIFKQAVLIFLMTIIVQVTGLVPPCYADPLIRVADTGTMPSGCTVFTISKGGQVFFGGNDDYTNPDSYYWIDPADDGKYGAIWVGQPDNVQQGVNEKGLAYDANGLPRVDVNPHTEREPVTGGYTDYPIYILRECATVEEVIDWVNTHEWHSYMHDQMHFADATGDAVIISAGPDGEVVFIRKPSGDGFLVSTNFNVAQPSNGYGYPCWRYDRATEMLEQMVRQEGELNARDAADVLDAVHVEGANSWTIESMVADLPNGVVYLYYFHQFDRPVVLDVKEELASQRPEGPLSALFPDDVKEEAARRYQAIQAQAQRCQRVGIAWAVLVLASLALLIILCAGERRSLRFWVLPVILLGPLALLVWFVTGRGQRQGRWRSAMIEALGNIMPLVIAFVAYLVLLIMVPVVQGNAALQIMLVLGMPLLTCWLVFNGLLLVPVAGKKYARFLFQRLPQVMVTTNLGMAGIFIVVMPLVTLSIRMCSVFPVTAWTVLIWWGMTFLGALVGGLIVFLYEGWAVRRGFQGWSVLAGKQGEIRTPPWRRLWWWILLSYVMLFAGFAAGAFLMQMMTA